jgi:hypothetical protein
LRAVFITVRHHFARLRRVEVVLQIGAITMSRMLESHVSTTTALRQIVYPFPLPADATIHHRSRAAG